MATTNCEICGKVIPAAESSTGGFLKTYCGCDITIKVEFVPNVLRQANYDARFRGRRETLLEEFDREREVEM